MKVHSLLDNPPSDKIGIYSFCAKESEDNLTVYAKTYQTSMPFHKADGKIQSGTFRKVDLDLEDPESQRKVCVFVGDDLLVTLAEFRVMPDIPDTSEKLEDAQVFLASPYEAHVFRENILLDLKSLFDQEEELPEKKRILDIMRSISRYHFIPLRSEWRLLPDEEEEGAEEGRDSFLEKYSRLRVFDRFDREQLVKFFDSEA